MKSIPFGIGKLLESAIARVRRHRLVRGLAITGIVWVLGVVALMGIDSRIVILDDRLRYAMTAGVLLLTLLAAFLAIVLPLRRTLDFRKMAAILDARHPEHEERLMTLVELSETDAKKAGYSASLFALVCDLAEQDAAKVDLAREFPKRRALCWFGVFAVLALVLGIGSAVSPNHVGRLFVRAVAPWADIGNLFSQNITVKPGDLVVLSGSVIRLEATPTINPATPQPCNPATLQPCNPATLQPCNPATLQPCNPATIKQSNNFSLRLSRKTRHGWTEETSEPMANGVYETTADLSEREWRYRVTAGPAVTRYYHVRVSEMPKYDLFRATVRYPDYTGLVPLVLTNDEVTAIRAVAGSRVNFEVKVRDPETVVDFCIGKEPITEYAMVSNRTTNWSLDLVNRDGFRAAKGCHPLASFIDQPPTVVIEKPTGTLRLPSHAKIPVEITATDDLAVTSAYLRVSIDNEPWEPHFRGRLDLRGDRRFVRQVAEVDLSLYNLVFAKNIRFDVVVDDACPPELGGPHSATSMPFTVQFAENESNYQMKELKKEVASARQDIDEARRRLNDAQNLARQVRDELKRNEKPTENAERNSERLAHELDEAEKRIEELRNQFLDDERFEPLTRPMDRLLDEVLKPTLEGVEKAPFREKDERAAEVDKAIPEMEKAVQELDELTKRLNERAEKVDQFEKAKDLAARQEALAKAAKEILKERPTDTAKLEAWKRLEEAAMRKTEELVRQKPDPDFAEARRKMETASRKMADLKRELEGAKQMAEATKREAETQNRELRQAVNDQKRAAEALKNAAARRADEAKFRAAKNTGAADQKAREAENFERQAAEAQRNAEDRMERGEALDGVKALQQAATQATQAARQTPQTVEKSTAAMLAQQTATEALQRELDVRDAIRRNESTREDLATLNGRLKEGLLKEASARTKAATAKAAEALAAAKKALGSEEQAVVDRLAEAALDTHRDAVGAERLESKLRGTSERTDALRSEENALEALRTADAEASALEKKILSLQQSAVEALERNDRGRAMNLQKEIARAQVRAAEAVTEAEDATDAREEATASQDEAQQATAAAHKSWNNDTKAKAVAAQKEAMESERKAQLEARALRALDKISAAEPQTLQPCNPSTPQPCNPSTPQPCNSSDPQLAEAAEEASDALEREVKAQAAQLGMSAKNAARRKSASRSKNRDALSGGGVSDEVRDLAKELKRKDSPDFFKDLFSRFGWFKVRGTSKGALRDSDLKDVPREYRDLVRRYFLKISEDQP